MTAPRSLCVVIPARNEEVLLPRCLDAVIRALAPVDAVDLHVVVVLDRCTDGSEQIARAAGVTVVDSSAGAVGAARASGVRTALELTASVPAHETWIATTDADSVVPATWASEHLAAATAGADLVVGSVDLIAHDVDARHLAAWRARHRFVDAHDHVFGANLGVRASAYLEVGGFPPIRTGEDVALVAALRAAGAREVEAVRHPVATSGRRVARAPGGFADYLAAL